MVDQIELLQAITEPSDFHSAIFFTYGADLAFFEEAVLNPLWHDECRNVLVFVDDARYADTVTDLHSSPAFVGRRYILIPVRLGAYQTFHPKLILLLGHDRGRLLIGSGNLTFTGFGQNHELYTRLDWSPEAREYQATFVQAWQLVRAVYKRWCHSTEAELMLKKAEHIADWLSDPVNALVETELFHSFDEPLFDQLSRRLKDEDVRRVTIATPFLDKAGHALERFYEHFGPRSLRLVMQNERAVGDTSTLKRLKKIGVPLQIFPFKDQDRYLHAKLYLLETTATVYLVTGSANCTSAAWLSAANKGNLEIVLMRKGERADFDYILSGKISQPVKTPEQFKFKSRMEESPEGTRAVELLDAAIRSNKLTLKYRVLQMPRAVQKLELHFSASLQQAVSLANWDVGEHAFETDVPTTLRSFFQYPVSCFAIGVDAKGATVQLTSNEIWITHADQMHYEISRHPVVDPATAGLLANGVIDSEGEWNDLFAAVINLVELDVSALKRRGVTYSKAIAKRGRAGPDKKEREVIIREEDDTDEALRDREIVQNLYSDLPIATWFDYLCGRLSVPQSPKEGNDGGRESLIVGTDTPRRRKKPSEEVASRFRHLVRRYIRALENVEYMQTATIHHIFSYYVVFQRIVWLLREHGAVDQDEFNDLVIRINTGFFGAAKDMAPVRCPSLQHHIQREWAKEWEESQALSFALGSIVFALENQHGEREENQMRLEQSLRIFACAIVIQEVDAIGEMKHLLEPVAQLYGRDPARLAKQLNSLYEQNLEELSALLIEWKSQAVVGQRKNEGEVPQHLAARATADYGLAAFDLACHMGNIERQKEICTELPFWLRRLGRESEAAQLEEALLALVLLDGNEIQIAKVLFEQGTNLFFDRAYDKAASKLRQAIKIAESCDDPELASRAKRALTRTEDMIHMSRE